MTRSVYEIFCILLRNHISVASSLFNIFEMSVYASDPSPRSLNNFAGCREVPSYRNVPRGGIIRVLSNVRLCAGRQGLRSNRLIHSLLRATHRRISQTCAVLPVQHYIMKISVKLVINHTYNLDILKNYVM